MTLTIYHNPACGTSCNVLAYIRAAGIEPRIVEYLHTPPDRATLTDLLFRMGIPARDLLRRQEKLHGELGLADPALAEAALIDAMLAHPVLINRPIVVAPLGVRLCRPSEKVLELLPNPPIAAERTTDAVGGGGS